MRLITGVAAIAFAAAAVPASAQSPDFSGLSVKGSPSVIVTDRSGQETRGRLVSWTPASIVLDSGGTKRTFTTGEAIRIDLRGDSVKNGALIGAGFGLIMGALAGGMADCPQSDQNDGCAGFRILVVPMSAAVYAAIGAGIDALIPGRTPLWNAGSSAPGGAGGGLTFNLSAQKRSAFVGWTIR